MLGLVGSTNRSPGKFKKGRRKVCTWYTGGFIGSVLSVNQGYHSPVIPAGGLKFGTVYMNTTVPDQVTSQGSILRVARDFVLSPGMAWDVLGNAPLDLIAMWRHLLLLGAIGPVAVVLGTWLFGSETVPISQALPLAAGSPMNSAVSSFVFPLDFPLRALGRSPTVLTAVRSGIAIYLGQIVIALLAAGLIFFVAPFCQGRRDARAALAVVIYGSTPLLLSAIGLVRISLTLLLAAGALHSCVVAQSGVRHLLGAPGGEASMLLGITVMGLYVLIPLLAFAAAMLGVPLID